VRYDIVAAVPQGTTREQLNIMLQNFLKERFNLATHHEVRSVLGYELGVARPTPKLRLVTVVSESQSEGATPNQPAAKAGSANRPGIFVNMRTVGEDPGVYLTVKEQTLAAVANFLTRQLSAPVSDVTGLTGKYDFSLAYLPPAGAPTSLPSSLPALAEALNAEVGLKLASRRIPLDMLVVDPVNKVPTEN
jgi:uncharacterized protein (TIGR03435 family)